MVESKLHAIVAMATFDLGWGRGFAAAVGGVAGAIE
jgi:hypothetical protein